MDTILNLHLPLLSPSNPLGASDYLAANPHLDYPQMVGALLAAAPRSADWVESQEDYSIMEYISALSSVELSGLGHPDLEDTLYFWLAETDWMDLPRLDSLLGIWTSNPHLLTK